jgi:hypothetical protein
MAHHLMIVDIQALNALRLGPELCSFCKKIQQIFVVQMWGIWNIKNRQVIDFQLLTDYSS